MDKIQELYNQKWYVSNVKKVADLHSYDECKKFNWFFKNTKLDIKRSSFFDVGCGYGSFYRYLKSKGIDNYFGSDTNENVVIAFKNYFPEKKEAIIKTDALSALKNCKENKFDCIAVFSVLEHFVPDYFIDFFSTAVSVLPKGGELWIHTPCAESLLSSYGLYSDLTHRRSFTLNNFATIAEIYNLKIIASAGKIIAITSLKAFIRYIHNKCLYFLNRALFAFTIGVKPSCGVFSDEIVIILKKY